MLPTEVNHVQHRQDKRVESRSEKVMRAYTAVTKVKVLAKDARDELFMSVLSLAIHSKGMEA